MLRVSKKVLVVCVAVLSIALIGTSVYAASSARKITAYKNSGIKLELDGVRVNLAREGYAPIIYDGNTYVPAKPLAEAFGATVKWNGGTQTVEITSGAGNYSYDSADEGSSLPTKDNSSSTSNKPAPSRGNSSSSSSSSSGSNSKYFANVDTNFTRNDLASDVYEANKAAAVYYFLMYADALESGDTSTIEQWVSDNIQYDVDSEWDRSDSRSEAIGEDIALLRSRWDPSVRKDIAAQLREKAKDYDFYEDSEYLYDNSADYSKSVMLQIKVDTNHSGKIFSVNFMIDIVDDTGKALLYSII